MSLGIVFAILSPQRTLGTLLRLALEPAFVQAAKQLPERILDGVSADHRRSQRGFSLAGDANLNRTLFLPSLRSYKLR